MVHMCIFFAFVLFGITLLFLDGLTSVLLRSLARGGQTGQLVFFAFGFFVLTFAFDTVSDVSASDVARLRPANPVSTMPWGIGSTTNTSKTKTKLYI